MLWLFLFYLPMIFSQSNKILRFNTTNNVLLKGEINEETSSKFIYEFNLSNDIINKLFYIFGNNKFKQHNRNWSDNNRNYNINKK